MLVYNYNYKICNIVAVCTSFAKVAKPSDDLNQNSINRYSYQILKVIVN